MSSDNCIGILITADHFIEQSPGLFKNLFDEPVRAFRVAHVQAPDNFDYLKENRLHELGCWMRDHFEDSPVFFDSAGAGQYAFDLMKEHPVLEYGIVHFVATEFNFPGC